MNVDATLVSETDRYDRVRDVLDRLEEGRSQTEAAIANLYRTLQHQNEDDPAIPNNTTTTTPTSALASPTNRPSARHNVLLSPKMDLSWKDGGRNFPRKSSQIGADYQVLELPKVGTFDASSSPE